MADTTSSTGKRDVQSGVERASGRAHEAIDKAAATASSYAERLGAKGDELMALQEDWMQAAREYVRENPLQALGMAVAAGYLLHMITRR